MGARMWFTRAGRSPWQAGLLTILLVVAGHRLFGDGPPQKWQLPREEPSLLQLVEGEDSPTTPVPLPPDAEAEAVLRKPPHAGEEDAVRDVINEILGSASEDERDIWFDELKGLPANVVRDLLRVRQNIGHAGPLETGMPQFVQRPIPAELTARTEPNSLSSAVWRQALAWHEQNLNHALTPGYQRTRITLVDQIDPVFPAGEAALARPLLDLLPGPVESTGRPLDLALEPEVYLQVKRGDELLLTRAASLVITASRSLGTVASGGEALVEPAVTIPAGAFNVRVLDDGTVVARACDNSEVTVGRLPLVRCAAPAFLKRAGESLLSSTPESGAIELIPAGSGASLVHSRSLELSNVNVVDERAAIERLRQMLDVSPIPLSPLARGKNSPAR